MVELMDERFQVHLLRFRAEVTAPLRLPAAAGAALRGALFGALREQFCLAGRGPMCGRPELAASCPVCFLLAPVDERDRRGRDVPRPYVLRTLMPAGLAVPGPAAPSPLVYAPGQALEFELLTFGRALGHFPYALLGIEEMGRRGLGAGRQGQFRVDEVWADNPILGRQEAVYRRARDGVVRMPSLAVDATLVAEESALLAEQGGDRRLRLALLTPTRLIERDRLVKPESFTFGALLRRLLERLSALFGRYGEAGTGGALGEAGTGGALGEAGLPGTVGAVSRAGAVGQAGTVARADGAEAAGRLTDRPRRLDPAELLRAAGAVRVVERRLVWRELFRASGRHGRLVPMGGLVGELVLEGELGPFLPWLVWGTLVHVGKDAAMGNGRLGVEALP